jgi:3-oxoadipate enol-lactonase
VQFQKLNGVTLHHQVISAAAGKPRLVFSNSLGTDFRIWRDVIVRLAGDFSILTYDSRGHGLSETGTTPYTIETLAADLAALIDATGFGPAIVCGVSVGGYTAQALVKARPDLVSGLVLCDTAHKIGTTDAWNERIAIVGDRGIEAVADTVLKGWFTEGFRTGDPSFVGYRHMLTRTPRDGYLATVAAIRDADFTADAPQIAVPTLCLGGEVDIVTPPKLMQEFAKMIPGARYELIRNAGHIPMVEQPEVVAAMIRAFADLVGVSDDAAQRH